ncbi:triose-phosphate isomerase [Petroclostridium sp. X23]|uniref:triose-phosphate isomerase n=1 Tax=Petroclostridium sp. X23 TaxID=3045146 RepID=UPI0024AE1628|nr:triose-phosphate isomerase [Petroclostridium sp. X23]WHH60830.1 triose-phosphate isomerase [Petroclostridium sp. X23]
MKRIFINLKRFEVPKNLGGICTRGDPGEWIKEIIQKTVDFELGKMKEVEITYLLPESLIMKAFETLSGISSKERGRINIGCQGVFKDDIKEGGNFGAFTTSRPAASMVSIGCSWSIIGHSEERRWLQELMTEYDPHINHDKERSMKAKKAVNTIINKELKSAYLRDLNVLLCVGESAEERGEGSLEQQYENIKAVIGSQLEQSLDGIENLLGDKQLAIGYEPIWAIGPGKTPPNSEYISFISSFIKDYVKSKFAVVPDVVYGGGLKEENVQSISKIPAIDGGLVALTRFTGDIGFEPEGLRNIVLKYEL